MTNITLFPDLGRVKINTCESPYSNNNKMETHNISHLYKLLFYMYILPHSQIKSNAMIEYYKCSDWKYEVFIIKQLTS